MLSILCMCVCVCACVCMGTWVMYLEHTLYFCFRFSHFFFRLLPVDLLLQAHFLQNHPIIADNTYTAYQHNNTQQIHKVHHSIQRCNLMGVKLGTF